MSGALILILGALKLSSVQNHSNIIEDVYYEFPHFWTNTGFCPMGDIEQNKIAETLLSDSVEMNLRHIAGLPSGAVTHVRIHWLLELVQFVQFTQSGVPIYDFTNLDIFLSKLDDFGLQPVIEFMGNPGNVFVKNPNRNDFYWEDFTYQTVKHYLNILGAKKVLSWRFESWNEPDLASYNTLNFTIEDFLAYIKSIQRGLTAAGQRPVNSLHFPLRGPAGLFKNPLKHPLCWKVLEYCNLNITNCPIEVLTYHRKDNGSAIQLLHESTSLVKEFHKKYPALKNLQFSNDEADPISGWSTPRDFQEDVRYAAKMVAIVLYHWSAKIQNHDFKNLESISHDNAFLSFHPYEFSQRTLLAHFQMNNTKPIYSQFIQKPVYAAMGMLSKLGILATDLEIITAPPNDAQIILLKTMAIHNEPLFFSWILLPQENVTTSDLKQFTLVLQLPLKLCTLETFVVIIEILEQHRSDPAAIWRKYNSPSYPNMTVREAMRQSQSPIVHFTRVLTEAKVEVNVGELHLPWIMLLRVCSNLVSLLKPSQNLMVTKVTHAEVLLSWQEILHNCQCLKTYEVWFQMTGTMDWTYISESWHLPYPTFQFAPNIDTVNGFYKVRGMDVFNNTSEFSNIMEYIEI